MTGATSFHYGSCNAISMST